MTNQPQDLIERQRQLDKELNQGGQEWLDEQLEAHGITFDKPRHQAKSPKRLINGSQIMNWLLANRPHLTKRAK